MRRLLILSMLLVAGNALAVGHYVDVAPKDAQEVKRVLDTLAGTITAASPDTPAIVVMLHGDAAHHFMRTNYTTNKAMVDQAAALAAYNIINVQVCAAWLRNNDYTSADLFPFVNPVPYGADELQRLADDEGYTELSVDL